MLSINWNLTIVDVSSHIVCVCYMTLFPFLFADAHCKHHYRGFHTQLCFLAFLNILIGGCKNLVYEYLHVYFPIYACTYLYSCVPGYKFSKICIYQLNAFFCCTNFIPIYTFHVVLTQVFSFLFFFNFPSKFLSKFHLIYNET